MKILLSPAKSLDFTSPLPTTQFSMPAFEKESAAVMKVLKKKSVKQLADLMDLSLKLAELNKERNAVWEQPFTPENARPALFAFAGDVYTGLEAYTIAESSFELAQNQIRILSGLYGILKPFDLIQEYRLEMGTSLPIGKSKNLYEFWKTKLTKSLRAELKSGELLVNLASKEYFSVLDAKKFSAELVTADFYDFHNGQYKMISFFAKKARGMMARYLIDSQAKTIDDMRGFTYGGYQFDANQSTEKRLVFTR
ncbi:MAG: peroxide stress protein YaaA [Flavobacterium sp.]|nr:peroxide stress protein YaaA [Flavobacterium sp.]